jgi:hypothetical protein
VTLNRELFVEDPTQKDIPNLGVAKVGQPDDDNSWRVLRYELESFVCEGQYELGLDRILSTYLAHLDQDSQPAVWVSGFYGSGKSHLVRVLEHLWRDEEIPGASGATARGLVTVSERVADSLKALSAAGKRAGGLWSAAGTLGAGAGDSVRLAFLGILFRAAGLPEQLSPAQCALWLHKEGIYQAVASSVQGSGHDLHRELRNLYVSPHLHRAILEASPDVAQSVQDLPKQLQAQFPANRGDISDDELFDLVEDVLRLVSTQPGRLPCTLVVLDEMQQYIGQDDARGLTVQHLIEAISSRFESKVLFVATGQSALQGTAMLSKLVDRFNVQIALSDADVESVIRHVVLQKRQEKVGELRTALDRVSGEISRQLQGARIAHIGADDADLIADYPLLPSRRRFWEAALKAVDQGGRAGQLRTQLKVVHEATQKVAGEAVGTVVSADVLYDLQAPGMLQSGVLLREIEELIQKERQQGPEGDLRARLLMLVFLVNQLPRSGFADTGVRATAPHLADLLVDDLATAGEALRRDVPRLLDELVSEDKLQRVDDEYQLQTGEGAEWTRDYRGRLNAILSDTARTVALRDQEVRSAVGAALGRLSVPQGATKTPRKVEVTYGDLAPTGKDVLPVWIRTGWELTEKQARDLAAGLGPESPVVLVFVPKLQADALTQALAEGAAAREAVDARANPITDEGRAARRAMETRRDAAASRLATLVNELLGASLVLQGGGSPVSQGGLRPSVEAALGRSADRLYPRFRDADHTGWSGVLARAHQGSPDPLEPVGHTGDVDKHPVCKALLDAVTASGTPGGTLRSTYESSPFGWSRDSVNGALGALVATGALRAEENGAPVLAKDISAQRIGKLTFVREGTTISLKDRLAVRALLTGMGITVSNGEEAVAAAQYLQKLEDLANQAGGQPPLPPRPELQHLHDLRGHKGNELLRRLLDEQDVLKKNAEDWRRLADLRQSRLDELSKVERLAEHAAKAGLAEQARQELDAIRADRRLLTEPNPFGPVASVLGQDLRSALSQAYDRYRGALGDALERLSEDEAWRALSEEEQADLLRRSRLQVDQAPDVATADALLRALDQQPLSSWDDRIAAVTSRAEDARAAAVQARTPKAVRVQAPHKTLTTEAEVTAYVDELRALLVEQLRAHGSVLI